MRKRQASGDELLVRPQIGGRVHVANCKQQSRDTPLTAALDNGPIEAEPPIVSLRGVDKRFNSGVTALDTIDLDIRRGEFLSLLGPSGCGKTTLLRIIAGLSEPSAGERRLALDPGQAASDAATGRIGFVFQDPTLMPWTTVLGNVLLPFRLAGRVGPAERERAAAEIAGGRSRRVRARLSAPACRVACGCASRSPARW